MVLYRICGTGGRTFPKTGKRGAPSVICGNPPSTKYRHGSVPTFSQCQPTPEEQLHPRSRKIHHTRRGFTKSQVNGRDHRRFVVLLMKQPEVFAGFFLTEKSSFGIENVNKTSFLMAKNLTIFLGWLLNHPLNVYRDDY